MIINKTKYRMKKLLSFLILAAAAFSYAGAQEVDPDLNSTTLVETNSSLKRAFVVGDVEKDMNVWYKVAGITVESSLVEYETELTGDIQMDKLSSGSTSCTLYRSITSTQERNLDCNVISIGNTTVPWLAEFYRTCQKKESGKIEGFYAYYDDDPALRKQYCAVCHSLDSALSYSGSLVPGQAPIVNGTYYKVMTLEEFASYGTGTYYSYYEPDEFEDPDGEAGWSQTTYAEIYSYEDEDGNEALLASPDSIYVVCRYYYNKKGNKVTRNWKAYVIEGVDYKETDEYDYTWEEGFYPSTIPSGLDWRDAVTVKLGSTMKNIPENCFGGSKVANFVAEGANFKVRGTNSEALYDYDLTTLYALGKDATSGEHEIPETVTKIMDYSMSLINNCTLVSYNPYLEYDENKLGGTDNHVRKPDVNLSYTPAVLPLASDLLRNSTKANVAYGVKVKANSALTAANVNALLNTLSQSEYAAGLCYVDFSSAVVSANVPLGKLSIPSVINTNCLFYFPEGASVSGTNVVVGKTCASLALNRDTYNPFYNLYRFTATTATTTGLPFSEKYTMVCMPYSVSEQIIVGGKRKDVLSAVRVAKLTAYDSKKNEMTYTLLTSGGMSANKGYLVCSVDGSAINSVTCEDVTVAVTANDELTYLAEDNSGVAFGGTFQSVCGDYTNYNFYGMSNNRFSKAKDNASFKPFSGFVYNQVADLSDANIRVVFPDDEEFNTTFEEDATGVSSASESAKTVVSVGDGNITVSTSSRTNVNVVSATGAVVFNGEVAGTKDFNVGKGIYIINGKKYIVK